MGIAVLRVIGVDIVLFLQVGRVCYDMNEMTSVHMVEIEYIRIVQNTDRRDFYAY